MTATAELKAPEFQTSLPNVAFKRILFATDLSQASSNALWYAIRIAEQYQSTLWISHVMPREARSPVPLDSLPHEMDRKLLDAEREMKTIASALAVRDISHHTLLERGAVRHVLLSQIERHDIDLLIMGTHGRDGINKLVLGSVAEELLRLAPCPVLTVGPQLSAPTATFRNILFATDFGLASCRAVPLVLSLAKKHDAKLFLLNLVTNIPLASSSVAAYAPAAYAAEDVEDWIATARKRAAQKLRELIPPDAGLSQPPEYLVSTDFTGEGILDAARLHQADLIVMGANHTASARLAAHIPWVTAHAVLCAAACPVLTIAE